MIWKARTLHYKPRMSLHDFHGWSSETQIPHLKVKHSVHSQTNIQTISNNQKIMSGVWPRHNHFTSHYSTSSWRKFFCLQYMIICWLPHIFIQLKSYMYECIYLDDGISVIFIGDENLCGYVRMPSHWFVMKLNCMNAEKKIIFTASTISKIVQKNVQLMENIIYNFFFYLKNCIIKTLKKCMKS